MGEPELAARIAGADEEGGGEQITVEGAGLVLFIKGANLRVGVEPAIEPRFELVGRPLLFPTEPEGGGEVFGEQGLVPVGECLFAFVAVEPRFHHAVVERGGADDVACGFVAL